MGTRTWTRKGVLTAAGRARQAGAGGTVNAAILDIWGDVLGDDGLGDGSAPAVAPSPPPPVIVTPQGEPEPPAPTPPAPPAWLGKSSADAPAPINMEDANKPTSVVSQAMRSAALTLAADPTTQLTPEARQYLQNNPNATAEQLLVNLNVFDAMAVIYEMRGWNAPATVDKWENIAFRTDIEMQPNGDPLLFWRSVGDSSGRRSAVLSAAEKQANLRNGREHFVGRGVYGQGTYAAAGWKNKYPKQEDADTNEAVRDSAGYGPNMTMFALKKGSNINLEQQRTFGGTMTANATALTKVPIDDSGLAAAILGYDAYRCSNNRYWVVLNRSAMIIADKDIERDKMLGKNYAKSTFKIDPITGQPAPRRRR